MYQLDDSGRCNGSQAAGGRVIEQDFRLGDDGAGDADRASHASREFGGQHVHGMLKFHRAEHLADAGLNFLSGSFCPPYCEVHEVQTSPAPGTGGS